MVNTARELGAGEACGDMKVVRSFFQKMRQPQARSRSSDAASDVGREQDKQVARSGIGNVVGAPTAAVTKEDINKEAGRRHQRIALGPTISFFEIILYFLHG